MKRDQVVEGMQVVVNDLPDTTVYTVKSIDNMIADLVYYEKGRECYGGEVDVSILKKPTVKQLNNWSVSTAA